MSSDKGRLPSSKVVFILEKKKRGKKIMMKIVANNVVASRPPERRPTADRLNGDRLPARAKKENNGGSYVAAFCLRILPSLHLHPYMDSVAHYFGGTC